MQALPGFRELYPADTARRSVIIDTWRRTARSHGFDEYDAPTLEPLELYSRKNAGGEEILGQLYRFEDGGGRAVALRPEMTPSLARMAAAREKHFRKPMKWFSVGSFFRYERQQRGRLREFLQFNADLIGDASPAADGELIALAVDSLRQLGFSPADVVVRLSHRGAWTRFLTEKGVPEHSLPAVLQVADKLERETADKLASRLQGTGIQLEDIHAFIAGPVPQELQPVIDNLADRGLKDFLQLDLSIVRGLAYYTGTVFEIFDRAKSLRAVAGGGRYDGLIRLLSDGAVDLPAIGFAMGDVVLSHLIEATPPASDLLATRSAALMACDVFLVVADESRRPEAFRLLQNLRDSGLRADLTLTPNQRVGKQFQAAESATARHAVVVGSEWPLVKVKTLATREESSLPHEGLADWLKNHHLP
ncbi:MAG: histidine--tRNA ligase [Terrimicrobiaceae bacterium]